MSKNKKVITLEDLREKAKGDVLEIPDWTPNSTIAVRVKVVDLTPYIARLADMPNNLKNAAVEVFEGKDTKGTEDFEDAEGTDEAIKRMLPILEEVCEECLVEPTYAEIQEIYPLTIKQKMEIFRYAMGGVENLEPFRS